MGKDKKRIGFIGAGNMATALVKGLQESGLYDRSLIAASDKDGLALKRVSENFGIKCHTVNSELVRECNTVVLSVKPQNMRGVLENIKGDVREDHLFISIAAGIPLKMILSILSRDIPLVRVMPNTPALVQKGISAIAAGKWAKKEHLETARNIFKAVGDTVDVEESMMDAVTALSGSGPGFVFRMMECMVEAGMQVGLKREISLSLVIQTFLGAAFLAKTSDEPLSKLRERVTSPGGTTAAGLKMFEDMRLRDTIIKAIQAAHDRSVELGKTN